MITKISRNGIRENRKPASPPPVAAWAKAGVKNIGNSMEKAGGKCSGEAAGTIAAVPGKAIARRGLKGARLYPRHMTETSPLNVDALARIADALERLSPPWASRPISASPKPLSGRPPTGGSPP